MKHIIFPYKRRYNNRDESFVYEASIFLDYEDNSKIRFERFVPGDVNKDIETLVRSLNKYILEQQNFTKGQLIKAARSPTQFVVLPSMKEDLTKDEYNKVAEAMKAYDFEILDL